MQRNKAFSSIFRLNAIVICSFWRVLRLHFFNFSIHIPHRDDNGLKGEWISSKRNRPDEFWLHLMRMLTILSSNFEVSSYAHRYHFLYRISMSFTFTVWLSRCISKFKVVEWRKTRGIVCFSCCSRHTYSFSSFTLLEWIELWHWSWMQYFFLVSFTMRLLDHSLN